MTPLSGTGQRNGGTTLVATETPSCPLRAGNLGLAIGDVAGHGLDAVSDMATARYSLRVLALGEPQPEQVMAQLDHAVQSIRTGDARHCALWRPGSACPTWTYTSAGHPPAMLRCGDGTVVPLDERCGAPLGFGGPYRAVRVHLDEGATLLLYTDGRIQRRGQDSTIGLNRLAAACEAAPDDPEVLCDHVLDVLLPDNPGVRMTSHSLPSSSTRAEKVAKHRRSNASQTAS